MIFETTALYPLYVTHFVFASTRQEEEERMLASCGSSPTSRPWQNIQREDRVDIIHYLQRAGHESWMVRSWAAGRPQDFSLYIHK